MICAGMRGIVQLDRKPVPVINPSAINQNLVEQKIVMDYLKDRKVNLQNIYNNLLNDVATNKYIFVLIYM